jgi:predicted aspartyl protease
MLIRKNKTLVAFAALLSSAGALAQSPVDLAPPMQRVAPNGPTDFVITPSNPAEALDPRAFELTESQVNLGRDYDSRMTMPVQIGAGGTYDFVIDTGSQRTIVATELAQRLALPPLAPVEIVSMAGRVTVNTVQLGGLRFGEHAVEGLEALAIDRSDLGSAGLIGLDSLKDKRLTLDFKARRMDVGKSRRRTPSSDPNTIVVQARSKFGQLILVDSKIDGRKVNVILDTGAEMSVGNMALFNSLKLKKLVIPPVPTTLTAVTGIEVPAQFTVVRKLTIGSAVLENVPMVFLDAAPFEELELHDKPAMLLGMRMLRLFDMVSIDFGNRHVDFHLKQGARGDIPMQMAAAQSRAAGVVP